MAEPIAVGKCDRELAVEMTGAPMEDVCLGDVVAAPGATYGSCQTCNAERPLSPGIVAAMQEDADTGSKPSGGEGR